jgi:hypothetical protein
MYGKQTRFPAEYDFHAGEGGAKGGDFVEIVLACRYDNFVDLRIVERGKRFFKYPFAVKGNEQFIFLETGAETFARATNDSGYRRFHTITS